MRNTLEYGPPRILTQLGWEDKEAGAAQPSAPKPKLKLKLSRAATTAAKGEGPATAAATATKAKREGETPEQRAERKRIKQEKKAQKP